MTGGSARRTPLVAMGTPELAAQVQVPPATMLRTRQHMATLDSCYTRTIITSVDFISAAAVCPFRNCISRAASEVMIEVIC